MLADFWRVVVAALWGTTPVWGAFFATEPRTLSTMVDNHMVNNYSCHMIELIETETFTDWIEALWDRQTRARIEIRIKRLSLGNPGDVKSVGQGISEMKIATTA